MPYHRVDQGECISSIADRYGFFADALWSHPENTELRTLRKNPNVLLPGDIVFIPDKRLKEVACATGKRHRFRRRGVPVRLRLQLVGEGGARAGLPYRLSVGDTAWSGKTDGEGWIDVWVPPGGTHGQLVVAAESGREEEYRLAVGHLDPVSEATGVSARLQNLGFFRGGVEGPSGGQPSDDLASAIAQFQASRSLPATGELNQSTRDALVAAHGG